MACLHPKVREKVEYGNPKAYANTMVLAKIKSKKIKKKLEMGYLRVEDYVLVSNREQPMRTPARDIIADQELKKALHFIPYVLLTIVYESGEGCYNEEEGLEVGLELVMYEDQVMAGFEDQSTTQFDEESSRDGVLGDEVLHVEDSKGVGQPPSTLDDGDMHDEEVDWGFDDPLLEVDKETHVLADEAMARIQVKSIVKEQVEAMDVNEQAHLEAGKEGNTKETFGIMECKRLLMGMLLKVSFQLFLWQVHVTLEDWHSMESAPTESYGIAEGGQVDAVHDCHVFDPEGAIGRGTDFASGSICFGNIGIAKVVSFEKVWSTVEGGVDNKGVTFYKPVNIPEGFSSLGFLALQNEGFSEGSILVAKNCGWSTVPALASPVGYTLVWSDTEARKNPNSSAFFWLPTPPDGYVTMGYVVTTTADVPSTEEVVCVRADLTNSCEIGNTVWETRTPSNFKVWNLVPSEVGANSLGIMIGTFSCSADSGTCEIASAFCLKNTSHSPTEQLNSLSSDDMASEPFLQNTSLSFSGMPSLEQLNSLIRQYGPTIYFHPDERYFPSSVSWFFGRRALLYSNGQTAPTLISEDGSNLPAGGFDDGEYWIDLPNDGTSDEVRIGNLPSAKVYAHAKPMFGAFTDIALWIFYPFNGAARAKFEFFDLDLGRAGEHVSDWEHVTLRIDNLTGKLSKVFFSQHSGGMWLDRNDLESIDGSRFVVYSSKSGHASYPHPGLVLQGNGGVGLRNDAQKSQYFVDASQNYEIISADYLGFGIAPQEPAWLQYMRKWGPKLDYDAAQELNKAIHNAPFFIKPMLRSLSHKLPKEVLGEEGPTGPKQKASWTEDEKMW
ncbi:hypothetical protein L7F22_038785 [Adiantum nelumboides]|nr:hypothetical protein [Adiantum nelumboides]